MPEAELVTLISGLTEVTASAVYGFAKKYGREEDDVVGLTRAETLESCREHDALGVDDRFAGRYVVRGHRRSRQPVVFGLEGRSYGDLLVTRLHSGRIVSLRNVVQHNYLSP